MIEILQVLPTLLNWWLVAAVVVVISIVAKLLFPYHFPTISVKTVITLHSGRKIVANQNDEILTTVGRIKSQNLKRGMYVK